MHNHLLFLSNVASHLVASMSGIASFIFATYEHVRNRKIESRVFFVVGFLFLVVGFDQAWQDEHRNAQILIAEKGTISSELGFWRQQSYEKDASLRFRDQMLSQNYSALIGTQRTAYETQSSLTHLSEKILEVGKPVQLKITSHYLGAIPSESNNVQAKYHGSFIVLTNQTVTPVRLLVTCEAPIVQIGGHVLGTNSMSTGGWGGKVTQSDRQYGLGISSPAWTTVNPIVVTIFTDSKNVGNCSFEEK